MAGEIQLNGTSFVTESSGTLTINAATSYEGAVPPGTVLSFCGAIAQKPSGYFVCDGSTPSRTTYAALFAAIGTLWGTGDGSSTFTLPDLRGQFLRGHDNGHGDDPDASSRTGGDVVGSSQADEFKSHNHDMPIQLNNGYAAGSGGAREQAYSAGVDTGNRGGNETRPKNYAVLYIIKF